MKVLGVLVVTVLFAITILAGLIYEPVSPPAKTFVDFRLGTGSREIAEQLYEARIIRSQSAFLLLRAVSGGSLKAGEYRFEGASSAFTVYNRIRHGDVYTRAVTIPEGFNLYDIARAIEASGLGSGQAFLEAAHTNTDLIASITPFATSLEGYLYPDTYRFSRHTTVRDIQKTMVRRFQGEAAALSLSGSPDSVARIIILASLVEKEVRFDDERALAAGVFENRLSRGMPLQTDPSVIYAALLASRWTGTIHRSDLRLDSPYNTYQHTGLPPGPICSPGAAAIRAALHPASTDKLYFVADGLGHTQFSASLREHANRVNAYRSSLR